MPVYVRQRFAPSPALGGHGLHHPQPRVSGPLRQGVGAAARPRLGLFTVDGLEFYDRLSFLKAGINFARRVTTVSPTYAEEIQTPETASASRDDPRRARRLSGILNGIDTDDWDPATRSVSAGAVRRRRPPGKAAAKRALLEGFGLPVDDDTTGAAARRDGVAHGGQKGLDLIAAVARRVADLDATFVVSAPASPVRGHVACARAGFPTASALHRLRRTPRASHRGRRDMFLMPSRFEPCGLNQMYSLRYGTVPVVRAVGGSTTRCRTTTRRPAQGTASCSATQPAALLGALAGRSASTRPARVAAAAEDGMRKDFSWERSARRVRQGV